jgi:hypothetical protein
MRLIALLLSLTLGLTTAAQAGFFNNRNDWNELPQHIKQGYAAGLYEGFTMPTNDDSKAARRWKAAVAECSQEMSFNIDTIVDLIENYYLDVANWKDSPLIAMMYSLDRACNE